jgi:putative transcriptional regulator
MVHQAVAIEDGVDRTDGGQVWAGELLPELLADPIHDSATRARSKPPARSPRHLSSSQPTSIRARACGQLIARVMKVPSVTSIRDKTGLSQPHFAELLGVSVRTLQEWEQGRRAPSGAARTLLLIAETNPRALLDLA